MKKKQEDESNKKPEPVIEVKKKPKRVRKTHNQHK